MRIRMNDTWIIEVTEVVVTPAGAKVDDKYEDMHCFVEFRRELNETYPITGEFECKDASTMEECSQASKKFMDELFSKGYIDISTPELLEKYNLWLD